MFLATVLEPLHHVIFNGLSGLCWTLKYVITIFFLTWTFWASLFRFIVSMNFRICRKDIVYQFCHMCFSKKLALQCSSLSFPIDGIHSMLRPIVLFLHIFLYNKTELIIGLTPPSIFRQNRRMYPVTAYPYCRTAATDSNSLGSPVVNSLPWVPLWLILRPKK